MLIFHFTFSVFFVVRHYQKMWKNCDPS